MPGLVRVVALHCGNGFCRVRSEVLLVDDPAIADNKGLNTGNLVLGGPSYQRKAANHHAIDYVVQFSVRRSGALPFQDLEIIAMEGFAPGRVTLFDCFCNRLADRACPSSICIFPSQPILLSVRTDRSL